MSKRFKRTVRMFKAARNHLVSRRVLTKEDAPSYFIECLLYNVPNDLFAPKLAPTYVGILTWPLPAGPCPAPRPGSRLFGSVSV